LFAARKSQDILAVVVFGVVSDFRRLGYYTAKSALWFSFCKQLLFLCHNSVELTASQIA